MVAPSTLKITSCKLGINVVATLSFINIDIHILCNLCNIISVFTSKDHTINNMCLNDLLCRN